MTEGIDVPAASVCILARAMSHVSLYIQIVGRVLRSHPGKGNAILLDLVDASSRFGHPTEDREYSLDAGIDHAITRTSAGTMRTCPGCSMVFLRTLSECPHCRWSPPKIEIPDIHIWNVGLRRVYAGAATAVEHKRSEYERLRVFARRRGFSIGWVIREYEKLFASRPDLRDVTAEERRAEFNSLVETARKRDFKPTFAAARYKDLFGAWPPRSWGSAA